jgi:prepilin-type N-terminal cleavage/methylation domain-containing protein
MARKPADNGFTLIESLVAVVIIAITIISITPPIFWATATRVQNRRAEQAIQLAQGEIDRVRTVVERQTASLAQLPPDAGTGLRPNAPAPNTVIPAGTKLRSVVPDCNVDDGNPAQNVRDVILVDTDPGLPGSADRCRPEFMIQTFRGQAVAAGGADPNAVDGFVMGMRVYSIVAQDAIENGTAQTEAGSLRLTTGLGSQRTRPLAVQYSVIVRSNRADGLQTYRQLCQAAGNGACFAAP